MAAGLAWAMGQTPVLAATTTMPETLQAVRALIILVQGLAAVRLAATEAAATSLTRDNNDQERGDERRPSPNVQ
jgi:hypothetical protein